MENLSKWHSEILLSEKEMKEISGGNNGGYHCTASSEGHFFTTNYDEALAWYNQRYREGKDPHCVGDGFGGKGGGEIYPEDYW